MKEDHLRGDQVSGDGLAENARRMVTGDRVGVTLIAPRSTWMIAVTYIEHDLRLPQELGATGRELRDGRGDLFGAFQHHQVPGTGQAPAGWPAGCRRPAPGRARA